MVVSISASDPHGSCGWPGTRFQGHCLTSPGGTTAHTTGPKKDQNSKCGFYWVSIAFAPSWSKKIKHWAIISQGPFVIRFCLVQFVHEGPTLRVPLGLVNPWHCVCLGVGVQNREWMSEAPGFRSSHGPRQVLEPLRAFISLTIKGEHDTCCLRMVVEMKRENAASRVQHRAYSKSSITVSCCCSDFSLLL